MIHMKARKTPFSTQRKATPPIKNIFHASLLKPTGIRYIRSPQKKEAILLNH